jgi:hypothetical protein
MMYPQEVIDLAQTTMYTTARVYWLYREFGNNIELTKSCLTYHTMTGVWLDERGLMMVANFTHEREERRLQAELYSEDGQGSTDI